MSLFAHHLSRPLSCLGRHLPAPLLSVHFTTGLEFARHLKWLTPPSELNGRSFAIHVTDLGLRHTFCCRAGRFRPHWAKQVDLELSADALDFLSLLGDQIDADTLFFQRKLKITGDTELGLIVKNWLDAAERPAWLNKLPTQLI